MRKIHKLSAAILLIIAPLFSLVVPGIAHANGGTFTWTGGAGDGLWSSAANWVGGVAPGSGDTGDTIIINNAASFYSGGSLPNETIDNIASLNLAGLQFENDNGSSGNNSINLLLEDPLTVTGTITQESSDVNTTDIITNNNTTAETVTLGGNVTVTSSAGGLQLGSTLADTIALGGNTLTFTDNGDGGDNGTSLIYDNIVGSGAVDYEGTATSYGLYGDDTYSGTTDVNVSSNQVYTNNDDAFGTSTITVDVNGELSFDYDSGSNTISNQITITGATTGTPPNSLDFESAGNGVTINVPNITLNGESNFSNGGLSNSLAVNLSGITSNGHCVDYSGASSGATDETSNGFSGGPASCITSSSGSASSSGASNKAAPKTPDTGLAAVAASPLNTVVITTASTMVLVFIIRKLQQTTDLSIKK